MDATQKSKHIEKRFNQNVAFSIYLKDKFITDKSPHAKRMETKE
jgi:hypothetical protein